jgi:hypothetical protein
MSSRGIRVVFVDEIEAVWLWWQVFDPSTSESATRSAKCPRRGGLPRIDRHNVVPLADESHGVFELIPPLRAHQENFWVGHGRTKSEQRCPRLR